MFKSIQWKVLTVFVLLIISVMIVVGTFLLNSISFYYHDEFTNQMEKMVFTDDFVRLLEGAATGDDAVLKMHNLIDVYTGRIGIDTYRKYYILNASDAKILHVSDIENNAYSEITQNLLSAMEGKVGNGINRRASIMDYAYPLPKDSSTPSYIIYISDTKVELYSLLGNIFSIIFWALFLGMGISVFLGLFLSRTIISPIASLKRRAEKIAAGDFEQKLEVKSRDEIGQLTVTFNTMAAELANTLSAIAKEKTKFETIFHFMSDAVIAFDRSGKIMHINSAAKKILNSSEDESMTFDTIFSSLNVNIKLADLLYLDFNKTVERDTEYEDKNLKVHFAPFANEGSNSDGVVVVIQDTTKQQKLDNARREFVANVSHELRTPITTIKSYAETLLENVAQDSMEANFLEVINNESDRMTRLVKDLLTLSLLDYDKKSMIKTKFSFDGLIENIVKKLSFEASRHNQDLIFESINKIPPFFGDKDRLEQVVTNIITNAIKYTPDHGTIKVTCNYKLTNAILIVSDTGIGIPAADIKRLFDRFYRVDKARSRQRGGTGLGLAIAKEIIDAHGGTIKVDSIHGKGTTITVKMPVFSK